MCGIAGILDPAGVEEARVRRMVGTLAHRGPDDEALHVESGVGLGFRRLSVIDPETGAQPLASEDGSVRLVCNGEIYNYREIRKRLLARGHRFATGSDCEVLVHLYEERGPDLVHELRGMFAFALWDRRRRRLLLARDPLGQKPLYWAEHGEALLFASEIKAILAVAPAFRRVDPRALDQYLALRIVSDPRSMFDGVRKLGPGRLMTVDGRPSGRRERRYWRLRFEPKRDLTAAEAVERLDEKLGETVRLHLVSDVEVGAFLSGGLDSGLVVSRAAALSDGPLRTYSLAIPGDFDEGPAARAVATGCGAIHREVTAGAELVTRLADVAWHADEPTDPLSVCVYEVAAVASRDVKVVLGGDGGDELFGGYDRYYGVPWVRWYATLPAPLRRHVVGRLLRMASGASWYKSLTHQLRWMHELAEAEGGRRYARALGYFYFNPERRRALYADRFRELTRGHDPEGAVIAWHDEAGLREALDRMLLADAMVRLPNHSVMVLDRMTMAHGLEARSPFLDHELAAFAARLPARLKVRGRERRRVQTLLARRYLPADVLARPKQGFASALPYVLRPHLPGLFERFLVEPQLVEAGWLRAPAIRELVEEHLAGARDHGQRLWLLLNAELWHRLHLGGVSRDALRDELADAAERAGGPPRREGAGDARRRHATA